jgi:protein-S-isoprenylcysteine O-methyltransferase Ste14
MQIVGKPSIHPILFYSGKVCSYTTWIVLLLSMSHVAGIRKFAFKSTDYISYALLTVGLLISILSMINLGKSTTLGIPTKSTSFRKSGLYRYSRNPMYIGFNLLTAASMIYHMNILIAAAGIYSIIVYHLIILAEERFLEKRFPDEYREYRTQVRRYI